MNTPTLNRQQSRRLDCRAMEEYGILGLVLMENAGRGAADVLCSLGIAGPVVICCGRGNNAGDGFVLARHLDLRGHVVHVVLWAPPEALSGDAAANYRILAKTDVPITSFAEGHDPARLDAILDGAAWIADGLLGTGAQGDPRPPLDDVIDRINTAPAPVLAIDLPSGLDCDTGRASAHAIRAAHTCTFAAAKPGFFTPEAQPYVGRLHVRDIGVPRKLIDAVLAEP
ncbi:MAG: NAD(P)H-hydrate epimerase [Pirellulales bacterium]|nr:NAD(P)H-hydrate epimerase [Pirellulales bacterium]